MMRRLVELIGFRKVRVFAEWKFAGAGRGYVADFQMRWRWTGWAPGHSIEDRSARTIK